MRCPKLEDVARSLRATALIATVLVLPHGVAGAEGSLSFSALPQFGYVGQNIIINVYGGTPQFEYRALTREPDTDWNFDKEWVTSTELTVIPLSTDRMSVDVQVRDSQTQEMVENKYLGDVQVLDKIEALQLVSLPIQRFAIRDVPSRVSAESSETSWRDGVHTVAALSDLVRSRVDGDTLEPITKSKEGAFALTAMQFVAGLWHYGNFNNLLAPGCVSVNETLATPKSQLTLQDYLSSPIGCCTDYATVLGALLQDFGLEHRIVQLSTHVFNEVKFDGEWWTLDANINVAYRSPWDKVVDGHSEIPVYRFQSAAITLGSRIYSDSAADFQAITLMQAATGLLADYQRRGYLSFLNGNLPDASFAGP